MIPELAYITIAAAITLTLFVVLDIIWKLPKEGGVSGADVISREIAAAGGDRHGGWMMGNIVTSPDASAGTLLAACGYYIGDHVCSIGILGGAAAAVLVFTGARICADKGYVGTSGTFAATAVIWALATFANFPPASFIAGMVIAILIVQGSSHILASRAIGNLWRKVQ
ncbi:MAG: hypothetical protein LBU24_00790 [Methanocalculaceae archaeon]|jgi:energy-converting hydrogenase A subunit B|nr:hypothetical protein [Methanocalculaceae archaeon]